MSTYADADLTLPSVTAALQGSDRRQLLLTIIFHPDTGRIGEVAVVPTPTAASGWVLGRRSPEFRREAGLDAAPLGDGHVSRQALRLVSDGASLIINRPGGSSRCRVGGRELAEKTRLCPDQLREGVPILLGHGVVLLLRQARAVERAETAVAASGLVGSSAYMATLRQDIARIGGSGLDLLVRGETGTGKELVARAIHLASRRSGPLVSVNMAAIPPGLAAASLFGSERGSYTGATRTNEGFFSQARGGTLFMDEIGDTPLEVQPQLLRALQEREIQAVGGAVHKVDVRVVSATDALLEGEGCDFKAALRHRLGAGEIALLPLRQHPEDIGELLLHFLSVNCRRLGHSGWLPCEASGAREIAAWAELFHSFLLYQWPGNVRQLANFASQVALAWDGGLTVPAGIRSALRDHRREPAPPEAGSDRQRRRNISDVGEAEFDSALQAGGYEVANVARQLGVSRQAVYRRMEASRRYRLAGQVPLPELQRALAVREGDAGAAALDLKVSPTGLRSRLRDTGLAWF